ncbi:MAG: nucleoside triphosphate pyrophosphohydrolase, partial [Marinilabiliaceae bacterium]
MQEKTEAFGRLLEIMDEIREKCPWDRKQTNESLRTLTIEETYELADAILSGSDQGIRKELGDLLLHIVFYAKIGEEKQAFSIKDVIDSLIEKLIYRHPHIFGDTTVKDAGEVEQNWEKLKTQEKDGNKSVLGGVPDALPAMVKANRIQDKARGMG